MKRPEKATQFAVIGLGRFGQSLVKKLSEYGADILACDRREDRLQQVTEYATHVAQMDAADEQAMAKLGIGNFDVLVLAMGTDFQASVLATMTAKELGANFVVVKASGEREKRIFESIGADMVVIPEMEMGAKIARKLMHSNIVDVLEETSPFQITEMHALTEWVGKSVRQSDIRKRYRVSLLAIIRGDRTIIPVMPEEILEADDLLIALCEKDCSIL